MRTPIAIFSVYFLLALFAILFILNALGGSSTPGNSSINGSVSPTITSWTPIPTPTITDPGPSSSYALYDNFSYDNGRWVKRSNSWDSNYVQTTFLPSNAWIEDGKAVLTAYVDNHTGGELKSDDRYSFGKYRASIKLKQTHGSFLTFFSYQWPTVNEWGGHNEIDIELQKLDNNNVALFSTWVDGGKNTYMYYLPFDPGAGYHTYGYDWYPDRVEFYIDDMAQPLWVSKSQVPERPMYVYLQSWIVRNVPENHGNGMNTEYVDWVTVEPL